MNSQARIREPLGEREATLPLELGGAGSGVVLPGVEGVALILEPGAGQWLARAVGEARVLLNGEVLRGAQPLADGDVLGLGAAQVTVHPAAGRLDVWHLAGNATVPPLRQESLPGDAVEAGVSQIFAAQAQPAANAADRRWRVARWGALGAAAALVLLVAGGLLSLVPVPLQVEPAGARASSPGLIDWHSGDRIFLLPGRRDVTFSHPGYRERLVTLQVVRELAQARALQVTLEYLPGLVEIDTGGVAADVLVDGVPAGKAPGEIAIEAGSRDVILRARRHLDHVARIDVTGGGQRQKLTAALQSSAGHLALDTEPAGATVRVDGEVQGQAPQRLELDAGLHQLEISAPGRRAWRSEVAIIAGQTLDLGRIDLALPPAVVISAAIGRQAEASGVSAPLAPSGPDAQANPVPPRPAPAPLLHSALLGQLVLLPAGEYLQGSDRREQGRRSNEVQRRVTLTRPFYLAATEVSNAQFTAFRAEHVAGLVAERSLDLEPQAVSNVTWNDAVEFCNWLSLREGLPAAYERRDGRWQLVRPLNHGFRLPTEAEWEYAARYVDGQRWQRYAWGDTVPPPRGAANLAGTEALAKKPGADAPASSSVPQYTDDHEVIGPVNAYARTPAGLHGMGGNVSEWMHDVYVSLPADAPVSDPMGPEQDAPHAIRGANWRSAAIAELRLAWRERGALPSPLIGFRVARFAQESP